MSKTYFFAGGGTGGHIYPALAVAQQLKDIDPQCEICFFCSERPIDSAILEKTGFNFVKLPAKGFSVNPMRLPAFASGLVKSLKCAKNLIRKAANPVIVGVGGFVAAPVILAASKLNAPIAFINVDIVPGKSNKLFQSRAKEIYLQFESTKKCFTKTNADLIVTGCPLRAEFSSPNPDIAIEKLGLDPAKKTILITGASSGALNINLAIAKILPQLEPICSDWQIIHLSGKGKLDQVKKAYANSKITAKVLDYYDQMHELLACAEIIIGRSGAVSVAEYAAAAKPTICIPYPYHKDKHQYLNAEILVNAGSGIIIEDDIENNNATAENLFETLHSLITDNTKRAAMRQAALKIARPDAARVIAQRLTGLAK